MKIDLYLEKHGNRYSISPLVDGNTDLYDLRHNADLQLQFMRSVAFDGLLCEIFNPMIRQRVDVGWCESMIVEFLERIDTYRQHGIEVHMPSNMLTLNGMHIEAKNNGSSVMTYLTVDRKPITDDEYDMMTHNLYKYVLINKKWVYVNEDILNHHKTESTISEFVKESPELNGYNVDFKDVSVISDNFKFDNSKNIFKQHQVYAIERIVNSFNSGMNILLADDMGLGKTATAIGVVGCINRTKPSLIVVPKSVVGNWINEFKKFAPNVDCREYNGSRMENCVVYVTTYGRIMNDESLCNYSYNIIVLDEAQQIKNHRTIAYERLMMMESDNRIAMTGTPIENSMVDLWSIMNFVQPGLLGKYKEFKAVCESDVPVDTVIGCIKPYCIRRLKSEIDDLKLPKKIEHIVDVNLSNDEKKMYNAIIDAYKRESSVFPTTTILKYMSKLKMICGNPKAVFETDKEPAKLAYVREIITNSGYKPFVIFTQFRNTAEIVCENLNKLYGKNGIIIDGKLSAKERTAISNSFQNGLYPFIVLTLKAGNCGLTLTKSCNLIHYDRWWNPAVENQATDRVYRIGQTNDVNIYKLVCKGTIEERISNILDSKTKMFNSVVEIIKQNPETLERKIEL